MEKKRKLTKPKLCQDCKKKPPYDLANISQEYKRDLSDWEWLCRKCHMKKDGRLEKFIKKRILKDKKCPICKIVFRPRYATRKFCSMKCYGKVIGIRNKLGRKR